MRIGGSSFSLHSLPPIALAFGAEDGGLERLAAEGFCIAVPTRKTVYGRDEALALPSILGLDFLREQKMALYAKPSENTAYLEK